MPTRVRSHAKINLGLFLGAPRADGFHSLVTVYQTLEMHDIVTVTARPAAETAIRITSNDERVPTDNKNTAWKMVSLALEGLKVSAEVDIHIEKRLPVQGGLGAGSANAVAAMIGLEHELKLSSLESCGDLILRVVPKEILEEVGFNLKPRSPEFVRKTHRTQLFAAEIVWAENVGSDVPLFLMGGAVRGKDRGQDVEPLPDVDPVWCTVAVPEVGVSTPQAFRDWDALCAAEGLTTEVLNDRLDRSSRAYAAAFSGNPEQAGRAGSSGVFSVGEDLAGLKESALVRTGIMSWIENDFERVVFPQHPSLAEIKRLLAAAGTPEAALLAALSGSGSALFGLYRTRGDAEAAQARIGNQVQDLKVQCTVTRTLPRTAYWDQMIVKDS
jgi:4-diphosphocytidyl-2-C-methyl-D-erythritol kinase